MIHMSAAAQVGKARMCALRDARLIQFLEKLQLEGLTAPAIFSFGPRNGCHLELMPALDRSAHTVLQPDEVVRSKRTGQTKVVVKAGIDGWPYAELGIGQKIQHGFRKQMSRRVAHTGNTLFLRESCKIDLTFKWFSQKYSPSRVPNAAMSQTEV